MADWGKVVAFALLLVMAGVHDTRAQWVTKWLSVGDLHHPYLSGGAEPENQPFATAGLQYPGIHPNTGHSRWKGMWISVKNHTDENGTEYPVRTSHIGPRILGIGEFFDIEHNLISRYEKPTVIVDGLETFNRPVTVDEVDPSIPADRMIQNTTNTSVGIEMQRRPMQWSNAYHDNYHIIEYIFTNTGNTDDDPDIELPDQTAEDVFFTFFDRPTVNAPAGAGQNSAGGVSWGQYTMNDAVGDGVQDYDVDFRAQFAWLGEIPSKTEYSTIGNPMWFNHGGNPVPDDTLGRLGGAQMVGTVVLHADAEAHLPGESAPDDPGQPHTMTYLDSDWSDMTTGNSDDNVSAMQREREWIERGSQETDIAPESADPRTFPHHAYIIDPDGGFAEQSGDPSLGRAGGWGYMNAYGPYTMEPGEQVRIVVAEGVASLSQKAKGQIGRQYRLSGANDDLIIPFDANGDGQIAPDEEMTKSEWTITTRDSLFKLFDRAMANFESGYSVPDPPPPPSRFEVTSGTDRITLTWENNLASGDPPGGWEVWRAQKDYYGIVTALRLENGIAIPDSARAYERIATLDGSAREYLDENVNRGLSYFYYLQAVGDANNDPSANTPTGKPLKSSRYYTQTYEPAFLKRAPGSTLSDIRVVPNPYNLAATTDVRFGDVQDKLAFYGLPAQATIRIYTEIGELVDVIEHTDGSGDEFWDLSTSSRQIIVSGIYLAVIRNNETGEQVIRKIIIIR
jgi:hypothetical protein